MKKTLITIAALLIASTAQAQTKTAATSATPPKAATNASAQPSSQFSLPAPEAQIIMIRSALVALNQANATNNYSVMSSLGSPGFRQSNSPQKLSETFAAFRSNQIDLSAVTLLPPKLVAPARIENGKLRMTGLFDSRPMQVNYDLMFEPVNGKWQMLGIAVNLKPAESPAK